jgi:hypothetical protein
MTGGVGAQDVTRFYKVSERAAMLGKFLTQPTFDSIIFVPSMSGHIYLKL